MADRAMVPARTPVQNLRSLDKACRSQAWFELEAARILALIGALKMPDLGGKKFVEDFRTMLQKQVAAAFEEGRQRISEATRELTKEIIDQSTGAAKAIRAEAATIREDFSPTTGNNPTDEEAEDPPKNPTTSNGSGGQTA